MFDGILFDLDGTLWDATATICASWNRVLARHPEIGHRPIRLEEIRGCMGFIRSDIGKKLFPHLPDETIAMFLSEQLADMHRALQKEPGILYPQVEETLALLERSARLFLVSNCGEQYIKTFFAAHHLDKYFTAYECAGRTHLPKSGNIALVVKTCGLTRPVYVGDTQLDADSSREAGVPFLHAAYGFGTVPGAFAAASFADIPRRLREMEPSVYPPAHCPS